MNDYWFKPKSYGYGATPMTWEGWTTVLIYVAIVFIAVAMLIWRQKSLWIWWTAMATICIGTALMLWVSWAKTDGQWGWRWGGNDNSEMSDNRS